MVYLPTARVDIRNYWTGAFTVAAFMNKCLAQFARYLSGEKWNATSELTFAPSVCDLTVAESASTTSYAITKRWRCPP